MQSLVLTEQYDVKLPDLVRGTSTPPQLELDTDTVLVGDSHGGLKGLVTGCTQTTGCFTLLEYMDLNEIRIYKTLKDKHELVCSLPYVSSVVSFQVLEQDMFSQHASHIVLCLAYASGLLSTITVPLDSMNQESCLYEMIADMEGGISCMQWSPDLELAVILTKDYTMMLMSRDFDVVYESCILQESNKGQDAQVSVGWGKKETQFHGSLGKSAALAKPDTRQYTLVEWDVHSMRVDWHGDAHLFAVSLVMDGRRLVRIYDRQGTLQSTSEPINKLHPTLSWKPNGHLMAASQSLVKKHKIIFIEKNGLTHGDFDLLEPPETMIRQVQWNRGSSILAVWIERDLKGKRQGAVLLYTSSNYHWYLSREITCSGLFIHVVWDPEALNTLHLLNSDGVYSMLTVTPTLFQDTSLLLESTNTVAVVDGPIVHMTPFKHVNTPPPYSLAQATFPCNINHVSFGGVDRMVVLGCEGSIWFLKMQQWRQGVMPRAHRVYWPLPHLVLVVTSSTCLDVYTVCENSTASEECSTTSEEWDLQHVQTLTFDMNIMECVFQEDQQDIVCFIETSDAQVWKLCQEQEGIWETRLYTVFPAPCPWIRPVRLPSEYNGVEKTFILGQTRSNKLYLDHYPLSQDCLSFTVHPQFILWTTLQHEMRFIETRLVKDVTLLAQYDVYSRRIERGSKIICACPGAQSVVMQMPRGNLETIYPRPFILSAVRSALDVLDYRQAFIVCRKHRIDLNLLFDHDPTTFLANVDLFVQGVVKPDYLNLFLSGLKNEDVTETMYPHPSYTKSDVIVSKTNCICLALREYLMPLGNKYMTSILTTFVKLDEPDLEQAMVLIKTLKETSVEQAEQALKYIIFLVNVEALYRVALGMYDFALVVMVAQQSHKDPREYLPFLTELSQLSTYEQRFRIDDYLGRREKALKHLRLTDNHAECIKYMNQYKLYKVGMELYDKQDQQHEDVVKAYAHHLFDTRCYYESGLLYQAANQLHKAIASFVEANCWREALTVAHELNMDQDAIKDLCYQLIERLEEAREFHACAIIYMEYLDDYEHGIDMYTQAHLYNEACRMARLHKCSHLIESIVMPAVVSAYTSMMEELNSNHITFTNQKARLVIVRADKAKKLAEAANRPHNDDLDDIDIMSDTSSMATTRVSAYSSASSLLSTKSIGSTRSSKARRKLERKKNSSKKGGIFEEEFLLSSLAKAVDTLESMRESLLNLSKTLVSFKHFNESKQLESTYQQLREMMKKGIQDVFPTPVTEPTPLIEEMDDEAEKLKALLPKIPDTPQFLEDFDRLL